MDVGNDIKIDAHERAVADLRTECARWQQSSNIYQRECDTLRVTLGKYKSALERCEQIARGNTMDPWAVMNGVFDTAHTALHGSIAEQMLAAAEAEYQDDSAIVDRLWKQLGVTEYTGKSIYEYVAELQARVRELEGTSTWTDQPPTVPGWYCWRDHDTKYETIFQVRMIDIEHWDEVPHKPAQWAGPIPMPKVADRLDLAQARVRELEESNKSEHTAARRS